MALTEEEILEKFHCEDCEEFCDKIFLDGDYDTDELEIIKVDDDTDDYSGPCYAIFKIDEQLYKVNWRHVSHYGADYYSSLIRPVEARTITTTVYE